MKVVCNFLSEAYSEPYKTSKIGPFAKTAKGLQALNILVKRSMLEV